MLRMLKTSRRNSKLGFRRQRKYSTVTHLSHPDVYKKFKAKYMFVVKTYRSFNVVAPDIKLEQTMQHSKNGAGGIIG